MSCFFASLFSILGCPRVKLNHLLSKDRGVSNLDTDALCESGLPAVRRRVGRLRDRFVDGILSLREPLQTRDNVQAAANPPYKSSILFGKVRNIG